MEPSPPSPAPIGDAPDPDAPAPDVSNPDVSDPEPAALEADGRLHALDPAHVPCARIGGCFLAAVLSVLAGIGLLFLWLSTEAGPAPVALLSVLAALGVGLAALSAWAYPPLKLRHARWRLSAAGLEIRTGVWFRHLVSVPRARVQHTDIERGPLERRFGLATLVVHTAGHHDSEVRLDGLRHETALAIRDHLLAAGGGDGA